LTSNNLLAAIQGSVEGVISMFAKDNLSRSGRPTEVFVAGVTMLKDLLLKSIIAEEDWENLSVAARAELERAPDCSTLLAGLRTHRLLSDYQATRIGAGKTGGLILGNYRVLERVGAGAMGVVFKAEHMLMRRLAAIKVMQRPCQKNSPALTRFITEMRAVAMLQHPNIVAAFEAGKTSESDQDFSNLYYLVMEFVTGLDMEEYVSLHGPLPPAKACDVTFQVASALAEANRKRLVHRDIKPSNILVTVEGQAKLTDFGLARHFQHNHITQLGDALGTIDYVSPEQAQDASAVDIRTDIYSLGATLFWFLTGQTPFRCPDGLAQALIERRTAQPPSPRALCPDIPAELDAIVVKAMALRPQDRFPDPSALMESLLRYLNAEPRLEIEISSGVKAKSETDSPEEGGKGERIAPRALIVDDDASIRRLVRIAMEEAGFKCREAYDGLAALDALNAEPADVVMMDVGMPNLDGLETLNRIRKNPPSPNIKVIMMSGLVAPDHMAQYLSMGADDFLPKPPSMVQLKARVNGALKLKQAQDRSDGLYANLCALNAGLEQNTAGYAANRTKDRNDVMLDEATYARPARQRIDRDERVQQ
jgi:putative two-component system response regulator